MHNTVLSLQLTTQQYRNITPSVHGIRLVLELSAIKSELTFFTNQAARYPEQNRAVHTQARNVRCWTTKFIVRGARTLKRFVQSSQWRGRNSLQVAADSQQATLANGGKNEKNVRKLVNRLIVRGNSQNEDAFPWVLAPLLNTVWSLTTVLHARKHR